jgi:YbbR domain-containing protein
MTQKPFLKRFTDSKIFWVVVSVLASLLLWVYVTSTEGVEVVQTFPGVAVKFLGADTLRESSGLIVTSVDRTTVDLTLRGPRSSIARLKSADLSVTIDLSKVTYTGNNRWGYTIVYPSGADESAIQLVGSSTDIINFYVDKLSTKPIDVKSNFSGSVAEGYSAEDPVCDPLTVRISGPQASIDKVSYAYVDITRDSVDATLSYSSGYVLKDADGNDVTDENITLETPEVTVTMKVLTIKEVPLTVTLVEGGGATEANAKVTVDPETITLAGDAATLDGINKLVLGTIDLSDFALTYEDTFTVILPDGTESLSGVTKAKVTVEIKGLATKKMTVTNFDCTNVTDGYNAEVITESLLVTVRAKQEVLDQIEPENLHAVADLTDIGQTVGVFNPTVKIYVDGYPSAGVVGENKIYIKLSTS